MTKHKPKIILYDPHDCYSDEVDVSSALEEMEKILKIELEDLDEGFSGEVEDYAVYVAYPLYTSKLVQCPHTDEGAYNLEIIPHLPNFKLADGKTNVSQLVKELHEANEQIATLKAENEKLREIVQGAAKVNLIDAEDKDGKVIIRMSMEGEQLFNPPQFVRLAKEYVADRNLLKGGE